MTWTKDGIFGELPPLEHPAVSVAPFKAVAAVPGEFFVEQGWEQLQEAGIVFQDIQGCASSWDRPSRAPLGAPRVKPKMLQSKYSPPQKNIPVSKHPFPSPRPPWVIPDNSQLEMSIPAPDHIFPRAGWSHNPNSWSSVGTFRI